MFASWKWNTPFICPTCTCVKTYCEQKQMKTMRVMRRTSPAMMQTIMTFLFSPFCQSRSTYSHLEPTYPCWHLRHTHTQKTTTKGYFHFHVRLRGLTRQTCVGVSVCLLQFTVTSFSRLTCRTVLSVLECNDTPRGRSSASFPQDTARSGRSIVLYLSCLQEGEDGGMRVLSKEII